MIRTSIGSGRLDHLGMKFKSNIQPPRLISNKQPYLMFYSSKLSVSKMRRKNTFLNCMIDSDNTEKGQVFREIQSDIN